MESDICDYYHSPFMSFGIPPSLQGAWGFINLSYLLLLAQGIHISVIAPESVLQVCTKVQKLSSGKTEVLFVETMANGAIWTKPALD